MLDTNQKFLADLRGYSEKSFYFFTRAVCGFDWLVPHIHKPLCDSLQNPDNNKIRVLFPRGWLKSTICSIAYPIWCATRDSSFRSLLVQNTFTNACNKLSVIRGMFERNELFRVMYPELLPDKHCTWKNEALCVSRGKELDASTFEAAGTGTQVTSRHYNLIVEDDTVAPDFSDLQESNVCPTKEDVNKAIGWHRLAMPLLVNMGTDEIIVVGTRWFEKDLLSWVKENEPQYKSIVMSAEGPGGINDPVYPERFNTDVLEGLKASLGPYMYSCLMLNKPLRSDDMIFMDEWFRFYETEPLGLITYTTVDPAGDPEDSKGDPDYNVVMTCGKDIHDGRIFVLDYSREKCSPGKLIDLIFEHVQKWHPVRVGVETVAYQKSLQYWLREKMKARSEYFVIESITNNRRSKNARVTGLQPLFSNGVVFLRPWMSELRNELLAFPFGAYDDLPDALSMQLEMWRNTKTAQDAPVDETDPFLFDSIVEELRSRNALPNGIMDVLCAK